MQARDQMPHFTVRDVSGAVVDYGTIWQRRHIVLVSIPSGSADGAESEQAGLTYAERLRTACADLAHAPISYVVTHDVVQGVPSPGAVVADRWGEIVFISAVDQAVLPAPDDLAAWAKMTAMRCG